MQIRRFYVPALDADDGTVLLPEGESQHALRVLRLAPGDRLRLLNGRGLVAEAELLPPPDGARHPRQALCRIVESVLQPRRSSTALTLCVAPPRGKAFDLVLKAATELGFAKIQPVLCRFGVARPEGISPGDQETLVAALKQSENPYLPQLFAPKEFAEVLSELLGDGAGIFGASPAAEATPHCPFSTAVARKVNAIWVGPEGGFAPEEEEALLSAGVIPVTIGDCTLRVETAVSALVGYLHGRRETPEEGV